MARFRRDIENPDGTFSPNPDWVNASGSDDQTIAVDAAKRRMTVKSKYITFDKSGDRVEQEDQLVLDPSKDAFVKLADEITDRYADGGGKLTEHWYNPKTGQYQAVIQDLRAADKFQKKELSRAQPVPCKEVTAMQETTYDSVMQIHDFVTADMGLPFTFDTASGMAVWNYPVSEMRIDLVTRVEKSEAGKNFTYSTYRMKYDTMGGPSGDVKYIIKRDETGRMVRAVALDPMPDFAFRHERWVCAPICLDNTGGQAYNVRGLDAGYLTDKARSKLEPALWQRQATILFAALSDKTAAAGAFVYEDEKGQLLSFANQADYDAAVNAHLKVRTLEGAAPGGTP